MTAKPVAYKAPKHLRAATRRWVEQVVGDYVLEPHHVRVLLLAAEAWDQGQEAREALEKHGMVFTDRFGQPRSRPEVAQARDNKILFARLVRELALDVAEPGDSRPPSIHGRAASRRGAV